MGTCSPHRVEDPALERLVLLAPPLGRLWQHLEPGGTLLLDNEAPFSYAHHWKYWLKRERGELPKPWSAKGERRRASDGSELELRSRLIDLDPLAQRVTLGMNARRWRDGELAAVEEHVLAMTLYFKDEIVLMLERA